MRAFWLVTSALLAVQLLALLAYNTHLYQRFDLSVDFAHNAQAWYLIGHGNLSPIDTVRITATPFWRDHFDLIIWPLSLLRWISPQPVVLLWLQDVAIVAAEAVTLLWAASILEERLEKHRNLAGILALVALVANPWWYEAASFDVHMPPLGLPFVVLAGYSFWKGRFLRAVIASLFSLLFGAVVVEVVVLVGLAALCSRRVRQNKGARTAALVTAIGLAWIGLVTLVGANQASNLAANYGYLASTTHKVTVPAIVRGALLHPSRVTHVLSQRWQALLFELAPTGLLGLLTPWGLFLFLGLLVPAALTISPSYSNPTGGAFQNLPAMPFIFIGSVIVLTRLAALSSPTAATTGAPIDTQADAPTATPAAAPAGEPGAWARRAAPRVAMLLAVVATAIVVAQGATMVRRIPSNWLLVSNVQAAALAQADAAIPHDAEVIASYGIMGRFAERRFIFTLAAAPQPFQVRAQTVYFVITPYLGDEPLNPLDAEADIRFISTHLGARTLTNSNGIAVLEWAPPAGVKRVVLAGRRSSRTVPTG
jgi:uncharacterized membrane protein